MHQVSRVYCILKSGNNFQLLFGRFGKEHRVNLIIS